MNKYAARLWIVVIVLGWAFDFLFWGRMPGLNFAIFMALTLVGGLNLLLLNEIKPDWKSLLLIVPIAAFAWITFWRQEPLTIFLAYLFTLLSLGLLAISYSGGKWVRYSLIDYLYRFAMLAGSIIASPLMFLFQVRKEQKELGESPKKLQLAPIARGLIIAIPVVAVFTALLASADLVFNQKLSNFFGLFDIDRIGEYILRLCLILFWAYVLAGIYLHAASKSQDEKLVGEEKPIIAPFVGFTETGIVLGSVTILFILFVIVQFQYFFGGNANIGVEGYTFSQYARRGFNELLMVAIFSLLLVLGLGTVTKRETALQRGGFSGLSAAIVACVLVILVSAFQRITLANDWHGYSRLRLYPQIFLVWVGILFIAVVVLEILHRERYFALAALLASFGFAISLFFFNVDRTIVVHNVQRAAEGKHFNIAHLASLSSDAVPAMKEKFLDPSIPKPVHEGIGAALLCYMHLNPKDDHSTGDWRSFNYSRWQADWAIYILAKQWQGYHLGETKVSRRPTVRTPGNRLYECVGVVD
jgi:hypothetical protein